MCIQTRPLDRRRHNPQARPSTSFVDHTIDSPWRNFLSPAFGVKFQREVPLFFEMSEFPYKQLRIGQRKLTKNQLCPSSRFGTMPACDGRTGRETDTRRQHVPRWYGVARQKKHFDRIRNNHETVEDEKTRRLRLWRRHHKRGGVVVIAVN